MAILQGIEITVDVDGHPIQEYDDPLEPPRSDSITKWVEAVSGATFMVRVRVPTSYIFTSDAIGMFIAVDGKQIGSLLCQEKSIRRNSGGRADLIEFFRGHEYENDEGHRTRPFEFTDAHVVSDSTYDEEVTILQHDEVLQQGLIQVTLRSCKVIGRGSVNRQKCSNGHFGESTAVTKKDHVEHSLTHTVKLGDPEASAQLKWYDVNYIDTRDKPMAKFSFKYRSKDALHNLDIIPQTPPPTALEARPYEELTREELVQLLQRQKDRDQVKQEEFKRAERIKRERDAEVDEILASAVQVKKARR